VNSSWRDRTPTDVRRIDQQPAANSGDEDDEDDEEVDPEGGNGPLISALPRVVILSEAKDLLSPATAKKQVLRFAQDDNHISSARASGFSSALFYALSSNFTLEESDSFRPGSNNWVVSGQHTVSGKPLLSNDMHLNHQMPNLWFEAHLKIHNETSNETKAAPNSAMTTSNFDVAGVTLPGIPFVIVATTSESAGDSPTLVRR